MKIKSAGLTDKFNGSENEQVEKAPWGPCQRGARFEAIDQIGLRSALKETCMRMFVKAQTRRLSAPMAPTALKKSKHHQRSIFCVQILVSVLLGN